MSAWDRIEQRYARPVLKPNPADEGDICSDPNCSGKLRYVPDGECRCFGDMGLCWACEKSYLSCITCEWEPS